MRPDHKQKKLPFTRKEQLSMRREIKLPRDEKWLLWMIDDHIDAERGSWDLTFETLAHETGMSVSSVRRAAKRLRDLNFIEFERKTGHYHESRMTFRICWANIDECAKGTGLYLPTDAVSVKGFVSDGNESFHAENNRVSGTGIVSAGQDSINTKNAPLNAPSNAPPPPPLSDPVVVAVRSAGVDKSVEAVNDGRASGQTDEQLLAVVAFFLDPRNAGAWGPGALVERLRTPSGATLLPDQGWPPRRVCAKPVERKPPPAAGDLEQRYGARLDAMTDADLRSRISSKRLLHDLERSGRNDFRVRRDLLQTMMEAERILT